LKEPANNDRINVFGGHDGQFQDCSALFMGSFTFPVQQRDSLTTCLRQCAEVQYSYL
jgi:hypothetical protein